MKYVLLVVIFCFVGCKKDFIVNKTPVVFEVYQCGILIDEKCLEWDKSYSDDGTYYKITDRSCK